MAWINAVWSLLWAAAALWYGSIWLRMYTEGSFANGEAGTVGPVLMVAAVVVFATMSMLQAARARTAQTAA